MKDNKTTEMWKNTFEKIDEKYITEAAELVPAGESDNLRPVPVKGGTGNLRFVLAAAAAVLVSFIGIGFFFKGTGIEPLSPSSGAIGTSNEEAAPPVTEISGSGTMTTTIVMDDNGEITTIVSRSDGAVTTVTYPVETEITTSTTPEDLLKQPLTMEKLKALVSAKGKELTWSDFEQFESQDIGSGLYIMEYPIDAAFRLVVGGVPNEKPWYIRLIYNVNESVFSITDNGAEGFEEFVEKAGSYLTLARLEEISEKYDISPDMLADIEFETEKGTLYHDRDKHFYPMYLVFEADNRLVINTEARLSSGDDGELISLIFEKLTGKWERILTVPDDNPAILRGNLYSQKELPSEIVIPEGITEIGEGVFMDCTQLEKVTLPSTLKVIGVGAFKDCTNLKEINIPYGVTTISERAFENCTSVYMVLPDTVTTIGDGAFAGCTQFDGTFKPSEIIDETEDFTLIRPVDSTRITTEYSEGEGGHDGIDYAGEIGDNVYAAADGTVTTVETNYDDKGYGKYVIIDHGNGFTTSYTHLDSISVKMFAKVSAGDVIGYMGSTGWSTGPHLHFTLAKNGSPVNPHIYLGDPIQLIHPTGDVYPDDDILYGYGEYEGHKGIDFSGKKGQDVVAAANGTVSLAGWNEGYGNCVIIDHRNGYQTLYGHLDEIKVKAGDKVTTGHLIGTMGSSGVVTGVQLHFELLKDNLNLNPADYIN
ncbi:MAG: peptidoglycan DD-metalloendopeptidase family protein [Ruminiclostridium sp.]|nr:peptidoglycan DD-metalloendopeptidase family protein [Ruminiclostridium sp.]